MPINEGTSVGRYEIRAHLGTGGMGEVYLAQDTQLERTVALKILPQEFAADQQRMQRFVQEARAASALNHPNIITIHEIGHADSAHFIATEFIDGETLRQRAAGGRVSISEALDIAVQVAGALTAAHQAGVIHRDIKPENVMVRKDGYVKVLDFGLAKPTERASAAIDSEAATKMLVNTSPGMIMGTVSYMSPEQTRGLALDGRTDIWSLGVTLYEMLTGRVPFTGETTSDVIVSVLDREPQPLADFLPDAPAELQRIVRKSLRKDKEERYQTIKDMLVDLRTLKQELEFEAKLERASGDIHRTSGQTRRAALATEREELVAQNTAFMAARDTAGTVATGERKSTKGMLLLLSLVGVLACAGLVFAAYKFLWPGGQGAHQSPFQTTRISRLTSTGKSIDASISPDGNYVAHIFSDGSQRSLWIRQVASSRNVQLVPPAEVNYFGATFSPDSSHIFYVRGERNQPVKDLYQISVLGGEPKKLIADVDSAVKISPDGKRLTFMRLTPGSERATLLMIANTDGTGVQQLASRKAPDGWWHPVWSPDGKAITCIAVSSTKDYRVHPIEVQIADASQKALSTQTWREAAHPVWLHDGSGLLLLAPADEALESSQIWFVEKASGQARRITNDLSTYMTLSVTADSGTLATVQSSRVSNIWVAPGLDAERAQQIMNESGWGYGIAWTPDGRIVYSSNASGKQDIWIVNADGTGQKQLTDTSGLNLYPAVSPDGRTIVFVSDRVDSGTHVWKMDINGGNLKQLTNGMHEHFPQFSPDGKWVIYTSASEGKPTIWKISIDGGEPVQLTNKYSKLPVVSPDGKLVACYYWEENPDTPFGISLVPFQGGAPVKTVDNLPAAIVRWASDGRALIYNETRGGVSNLWSQAIDGGQPKKLTEWKSERIFDFAFSNDGKRLALSRGVVTNDVILISDFKEGMK